MRRTILTIICTIVLANGWAQSPFLRDDARSWVLVDSDEFEGDTVDWSRWQSEDPRTIKHATYRGPENALVRDGELRLYVTKQSKNGSEWMAASIYLTEPLEYNSYVECRFKSTQCPGVNNAFWLACRTAQGGTYNNRYEVDIVEARYNTEAGCGLGHVAWHDWKTYGYTFDADGHKFDVAQGMHVAHDFSEYHVWGLWYGENEMIYYLDGSPVWTAKTHPKYTDQWYTGVGKADTWRPDEEKRAYGRYGQDDWSYMGGYNGDKMNIILSTLPWGEETTPLTDAAHGTYMAVDYVRVYKPAELLNGRPAETICPETAEVALTGDYSLASDAGIYFSFLADDLSGDDLSVVFNDASGKAVAHCGLDREGIYTGIGASNSHTSVAYPSKERAPFIRENGKRTLVVCRFTAKAGGCRDAMSVAVFDYDAVPVRTEPYFYPNIDAAGNTAFTNEWTINSKAYSDASIRSLSFAGNWKISEIRVGHNYLSVLPDSWKMPQCTLSGCHWGKKGETWQIPVELTGKSPFEIAYSYAGHDFVASGLPAGKIGLPVQVTRNGELAIRSVTDGDGKPARVNGRYYILTGKSRSNTETPVFDTYVQNGRDENFSAYQNFEMKGDARYARQLFLTFPITGLNAEDPVLLSLYCTENERNQPLVLAVDEVTKNLSRSVTWSSRPSDAECIPVSEMNVPGGTGYAVCDVSDCIRRAKSAGKARVTFRLAFADGDRNNMVRFQQGHDSYGTNPPALMQMKFK